MKTMTVSELKSRFSEALDAVREGETIVVSFGHGCKKVAAMVPYSELSTAQKRLLGLLKSKARLKIGLESRSMTSSFLEHGRYTCHSKRAINA